MACNAPHNEQWLQEGCERCGELLLLTGPLMNSLNDRRIIYEMQAQYILNPIIMMEVRCLRVKEPVRSDMQYRQAGSGPRLDSVSSLLSDLPTDV